MGSFPIDVDDDGTPRAALDLAGQAVRAFNHRSSERFHDGRGRDGWTYVPDVYRCLGELTYLTGMLPQVADHMRHSMRAALEAGHADADPGSEYEGRPKLAIDRATEALKQAAHLSQQLYAAWGEAQAAINRIHYSGPDLGDDGE